MKYVLSSLLSLSCDVLSSAYVYSYTTINNRYINISSGIFTIIFILSLQMTFHV